MKPVILVFAKAPAPGRVKTRLAVSLGPEPAAQLYTAFVRDTLDLARGVTGADIELHTDTETDAWSRAKVPTFLQVDGDLGLKMFHALHAALANGHPQALILGGDAPGLPPGHLEALLSAAADVALGPAEDGGYYAVACRRVHPAMFHGVEWSGPRALEQTAAAASACGLSVEFGPCWFDIDEARDLERLAALPALPPHTQACLQHLGFR